MKIFLKISHFENSVLLILWISGDVHTSTNKNEVSGMDATGQEPTTTTVINDFLE